jgi:hypothetical protein
MLNKPKVEAISPPDRYKRETLVTIKEKIK